MTETPLPPVALPPLSAGTPPDVFTPPGTAVDLPPEQPPADGGKPVISQRQANWHVHVAGLRAQEAAEKEKVDPAAVDALLSQGSVKVIGGHAFPRISAAFHLLLPRLDKLIGQNAETNNESFHLMAMAHALSDPMAAWQALRGDMTAYADLVFGFASQFGIDDLRSLNSWITSELQRMQGEAQDVGKSGQPATPAEDAE